MPDKWKFYYDGNCAFCRSSMKMLARTDLFGRIEWVPFQSLESLPPNVTRVDL